MLNWEGVNREGAKGRRGKKFFILGILCLQGVALAARRARNLQVARGEGAAAARWYTCRAMTRPLDYAALPTETKRTGIGYYIILTVNVIGLLVSLPVFVFEVSGDSYAPMLGLIVGDPVTLGVFVSGAVPACIYLGNHRARMTKAQAYVLFVGAMLCAIIPAAGAVLAWVLPRTHGSGR
jgi:hypothetical protein